MKSTFQFQMLVCISISTLMLSCSQQKEPISYPKTDLSKAALIPLPQQIIATETAFGLDKNTVIYTSSKANDFKAVAQHLSDNIHAQIGVRMPINSSSSSTVSRIIYINQSSTEAIQHKEGYQLYLTNDSIFINAANAEGAFRGVQTLQQLIPQEKDTALSSSPMWLIPSGKIIDEPNYTYRGTMLDVARHFFTVTEVKRYIRFLAYYKINYLHLHLSDDQGWRIAINAYPKLTEIGSLTEVGGGNGGFYTQEEYSDIVAYAAKHYITIIPEIDMPGHTNAASVAYPYLNGNGKKLTAYTGTKVGFSTFNTRSKKVYDFIDTVIEEIAALTPGPYFHIGGDESHSTKKADYVYFMDNVIKIVQKHGKTTIGWDEIATSNAGSTSVSQFWASEKNAVLAKTKRMKLIMSPAKRAYLDMQYDSLSKHGLHWAAFITVKDGYDWQPETYTEGIEKDAILGIEAPLWSETISNSTELEYLAFPRILGYAELGWSAPSARNWEDYRIRLAKQTPYFKRNTINYYPSSLIDWE